jgi:protein TonB
MNRIASTFVIAAALCATGGSALAGEEGFSLPVLNQSLCAAPIYPKSSLRSGEEGVVVMAVHVGADGSVLDTKIMLSSGSPALDQATQAGNRHCRFTPGQVGSRPVAMWMQVPYIWALDPSYAKLAPKLAEASFGGNAGARYLLGVVLERRAKSEAERREAMQLTVSAAELGEPMAQIALGERYEDGKLVDKDMDEARRWYARAAAQGNVYAIDHLRFIGAPH